MEVAARATVGKNRNGVAWVEAAQRGQSDIANTVARPLQCALYIIEHRPTLPQTLTEVPPQTIHGCMNLIDAARGSVPRDPVLTQGTLLCGAPLVLCNHNSKR